VAGASVDRHDHFGHVFGGMIRWSDHLHEPTKKLRQSECLAEAVSGAIDLQVDYTARLRRSMRAPAMTRSPIVAGSGTIRFLSLLMITLEPAGMLR
jgi:hypothetical protein